MIRVLIAEDSVTVQELLAHILRSDPGIEVVGTASNGREALDMTQRLRPDVIVMDINMPVMNGFEATKQIMIHVPTPIVIVSASMNVKEVMVSMAALHAGALAVMEKPLRIGAEGFAPIVQRFLSTVKAMANVKVVRHRNTISPQPSSAQAASPAKVRVFALAASTGGPAALSRILSVLPEQLPVPVLVVQHISPGFEDGLAIWLNSISPLNVKVAVQGEPLSASTVYLAPDGFHMGVTPDRRIALDGADPIGGFRPSANRLFDTVGKVFGTSAVGVILTGMGQDGLDGLLSLRDSGGRVVAQDEASSIVFGMPKAAIQAGIVSNVLPLHSIAEWLIQALEPTPQFERRA